MQRFQHLVSGGPTSSQKKKIPQFPLANLPSWREHSEKYTLIALKLLPSPGIIPTPSSALHPIIIPHTLTGIKRPLQIRKQERNVITEFLGWWRGHLYRSSSLKCRLFKRGFMKKCTQGPLTKIAGIPVPQIMRQVQGAKITLAISPPHPPSAPAFFMVLLDLSIHLEAFLTFFPLI